MNRGSIDVVGNPRRRDRNQQAWLKHGLVVVGLLSVGAGFARAQSFNEYPVPTANSQPWGITAGPDGNIWFTERAANKIGMVTSGGVFTEYPVPTSGSWPYGITAGPDGNLWFVESAGNRIGKLTPSGTFTEYPVPTANSALLDITAGPDGNL